MGGRGVAGGAAGYASRVGTRLALFPLGTVLFPGLVLPLHVFEERYQTLVRDLRELDEEEREFGVVAIARGWEVEAGQSPGNLRCCTRSAVPRSCRR